MSGRRKYWRRRRGEVIERVWGGVTWEPKGEDLSDRISSALKESYNY